MEISSAGCRRSSSRPGATTPTSRSATGCCLAGNPEPLPIPRERVVALDGRALDGGRPRALQVRGHSLEVLLEPGDAALGEQLDRAPGLTEPADQLPRDQRLHHVQLELAARDRGADG